MARSASPSPARTFYQALKEENDLARIQYFTGCHAWDMYRALHPDLGLAAVPRPGADREIYLRPDERPELVVQMVEEMLDAIDGSEDTRRYAEQFIYRLLGIAVHEFDLPLPWLCRCLRSPRQLGLLMVGSYPIPADGSDLDPKAEARRWQEDGYRMQVVTEIQRSIKFPRSVAPLGEHPLIAASINWMLDRGTAASAAVATKVIKAVLRYYFKADSSQEEWLGALKSRATKRRRRGPPTSRMLHKQALGLAPDLWGTLATEGLDRLLAKVAEPWEVVQQNPGNDYWLRLWATAVRDAFLFALLLFCPLRPKEITRARLNVDVFPKEGAISILGCRTKSGVAIYRSLMKSGRLAILRQLLDAYLTLARPVILAGRETSYLFVTNPMECDVLDECGEIMPGRLALAQLLVRLSKERLDGLLPTGLDHLAPSLFRHLLSNWAAEHSGNYELPAIALSNTPQIAAQYYVSRALKNGHTPSRQHANDKRLGDFLDASLEDFGASDE
ncbi:MAG: hypothetical protein FJZ01_23855 [Candidatus Sericytochromatia bacterium]|nr:hypothetical protein [Candidatus Tanganyikabacteria bacterium]